APRYHTSGSLSMRLPSLSVVVLAAAMMLASFAVAPLCAQPAADTITVQVRQPGAAISPTMFGIFFEDINFGADGGLYPERVKNRSFEFTEPLAGWSKADNFAGEGQFLVRSEAALNDNNPHYLRLHIDDPKGFGVVNTGFRGMGLTAGTEYTFSAYVRVPGAGPKTLHASLTTPRNRVIGEATLTGFGG